MEGFKEDSNRPSPAVERSWPVSNRAMQLPGTMERESLTQDHDRRDESSSSSSSSSSSDEEPSMPPSE